MLLYRHTKYPNRKKGFISKRSSLCRFIKVWFQVATGNALLVPQDLLQLCPNKKIIYFQFSHLILSVPLSIIPYLPLSCCRPSPISLLPYTLGSPRPNSSKLCLTANRILMRSSIFFLPIHVTKGWNSLFRLLIFFLYCYIQFVFSFFSFLYLPVFKPIFVSQYYITCTAITGNKHMVLSLISYL
jgi:hypothetical protein